MYSTLLISLIFGISNANILETPAVVLLLFSVYYSKSLSPFWLVISRRTAISASWMNCYRYIKFLSAIPRALDFVSQKRLLAFPNSVSMMQELPFFCSKMKFVLLRIDLMNQNNNSLLINLTNLAHWMHRFF